MYKRLRVRLYPNLKQKLMLDNHLSAYRFCYNLCLEYKSTLWYSYGKNVTGYEMQKELGVIRNSTEWLKNCKSEVITQAALHLDASYKKFYSGKGFPKYKSKKGEQSFHAYRNVKCINSKVKYFKHLIKFNTSFEYNKMLETHELKHTTFKKDREGNYWATFLIDTKEIKLLPKTKNEIGIDLGIKSLLITSEGEVFDNNRYLQNYYFKLRRLQRKYSKTKNGGKNRDKIRLKIAKEYVKINNKKEHYYHQITNQLLRDNQTIYIEDLSSKNMMANHKLAKSISDASWGMLIGMLEYKAKWYGRDIIKVNRFYPSSKTCSNCGNKKEELKLSERIYNCEACGFSLDRDENAAINILKEGQRISGIKIPVVPVEDSHNGEAYEAGSNFKYNFD